MNILKINTDNTMLEIKAQKNWISTIKKNNQSNEISLLFEWFINNDCKLLLYGNLDGSQLNNHILPSNGMSSYDLNIISNDYTLYDNIYIVKIQANILINFSIKEYGEFYSINYDSNSNCSSDEDDIEYVVNNNYNLKYNNSSNNILNYDNNIY